MRSRVQGPYAVACVRYVSDDSLTIHCELRDGRSITSVSTEPFSFSVGSIVFISEQGQITNAPRELWYEEPWLGVVKHVLPDRVVIDVGGRLRLMPQVESISLQVGNTVEGTDTAGVVGVISEDPIRYLDLPTVGDQTIEHFKAISSRDLSFDDFGGSPEIVKRARELIEFPLEHHEALAKIGARPVKGVLFTGQPGTGKTLLARIIASRAGAVFYEVSGPEVLSKWYGQSEELIRKIFDDASQQERAIIFFDEIDSLATQRRDESHEASRRIVGQLLASMDGFSRDTNVVVIATTNRPQDIDVALRRPGRFDWEINFASPSKVDREAILVASARHLQLGEDLPYAVIADRTENWTPAELAAIWTEAAYLAVEDKREQLLAEDFFGGFEKVARQRAEVLVTKSKDEGTVE